MVYEVIINKKFNYVKLYTVLKSVKGGQNQISRVLTGLVEKYLLKKKDQGQG